MIFLIYTKNTNIYTCSNPFISHPCLLFLFSRKIFPEQMSKKCFHQIKYKCNSIFWECDHKFLLIEHIKGEICLYTRFYMLSSCWWWMSFEFSIEEIICIDFHSRLSITRRRHHHQSLIYRGGVSSQSSSWSSTPPHPPLQSLTSMQVSAPVSSSLL